jgi:hypothetical protein
VAKPVTFTTQQTPTYYKLFTMSFLAKLNLDGVEFNIIDFEYDTQKNRDANGNPASSVKAGTLRILIESNTKVDFFDWAVSDTATKDGEIVLYKRDSMSSLKKVAFTGAYCISSREKFSAEDNKPMRTFLFLSAKKLSVKEVPHDNNWASKVMR